ncbi:MAG: putative toxin-antitoxin system toxin component, PIN family [Burkholderiales bacterium]
MIIVVDTNVLISAMLDSGGASREVLRQALQGRHEPLIGAALFAEYEAVLGRDELFRRCILDRKERNEFLDAFLSVCKWTRVYFTWRPNIPDESDNHVVELAVAGGASAIVTKNVRHFAGMELRFENLRIMTPAKLIKG